MEKKQNQKFYIFLISGTPQIFYSSSSVGSILMNPTWLAECLRFKPTRCPSLEGTAVMMWRNQDTLKNFLSKARSIAVFVRICLGVAHMVPDSSTSAVPAQVSASTGR